VPAETTQLCKTPLTIPYDLTTLYAEDEPSKNTTKPATDKPKRSFAALPDDKASSTRQGRHRQLSERSFSPVSSLEKRRVFSCDALLVKVDLYKHCVDLGPILCKNNANSTWSDHGGKLGTGGCVLPKPSGSPSGASSRSSSRPASSTSQPSSKPASSWPSTKVNSSTPSAPTSQLPSSKSSPPSSRISSVAPTSNGVRPFKL
jgi:hypothetical protein